MANLKQLTPDQLTKLKSPLPNEAVRPHPTKNYLSTIKAIFVVERFNEVFGLGGWQINNEVVEATEKNIVVKSTFHAPDYGIVVPDIFGGNDNPDRGDAYKGACTDALTKIGSYLYVGMDVYKGINDNRANAATHPQEKVYQAKALTPTPHEKGKIQPNVATVPGAELPWLSQKQFDDCIYRINSGELDVLEKAKANFRMKKEFREQLESAVEFSNNLTK